MWGVGSLPVAYYKTKSAIQALILKTSARSNLADLSSIKIKKWLHAHSSFDLDITGNGSNEDVIAWSSNQNISTVDFVLFYTFGDIW